jgi:L-ribulose-5-phosphate 3-epimerase
LNVEINIFLPNNENLHKISAFWDMKRRDLLRQAALLGCASALPAWELADTFSKFKFRIAACDWSIDCNSDLQAFDVAKQIGLAGIQCNLGFEANDLHLRRPERQREWLAASARTGVKITSIAIGELNEVPYKSEQRTEAWVSDSIDVAKAFGVDVVLLAFFIKNDLRNDPAGKAEVVRRLKMVAPKAEKAGVTLGLETYISAEEHLDIMQQVGSPNVKVYYDFRNSADAGYDILRETRLLGKDNICGLHIKENGYLLEKGSLNWHSIRDVMEESHCRADGWLHIEWAHPDEGDIVAAHRKNVKFLKKVFG